MPRLDRESLVNGLMGRFLCGPRHFICPEMGQFEALFVLFRPYFVYFLLDFQEKVQKVVDFLYPEFAPKSSPIMTPSTSLLAHPLSLKKSARMTAKTMKQKRETNLLFGIP